MGQRFFVALLEGKRVLEIGVERTGKDSAEAIPRICQENSRRIVGGLSYGGRL